jgi:multidrug resistance efflux pump
MERNKRNRILLVSVLTAAVLVGLYFRHQRLFPGTDDAYIEADIVGIVARVSGPIVNLPIVDNQLVEAGQLLFEVDPRPFRIAVDAARAKLDRTGQNVSASADGVSSAEAGLARAQAGLRLAEVQFKRIQPLAKVGALSFQDRDKAQANLDSAQAGVAAAKAELAEARSELGELGAKNADTRAALAELANAELQLEYTRAVAPVNGYVTNLGLSLGSYIGPGAPALSLVDTDSWHVLAYMKETDLRRIEIGHSAEVYLPAYPHLRFNGLVQGIGWGIDRQDGATGNEGLPSVSPTVDWVRMAQRFPVRITLVDPSPEHPLRRSMTATVRINANAERPRTGGETPAAAR